jgi:hypothetical protein
VVLVVLTDAESLVESLAESLAESLVESLAESLAESPKLKADSHVVAVG